MKRKCELFKPMYTSIILFIGRNSSGGSVCHWYIATWLCSQSYSNKATRSPEISREQVQKLTPQFLLYIYWI